MLMETGLPVMSSVAVVTRPKGDALARVREDLTKVEEYARPLTVTCSVRLVSDSGSEGSVRVVEVGAPHEAVRMNSATQIRADSARKD